MKDTNYQVKYWKTIKTFIKVGSCSETMCNVVNKSFENPRLTEEKATMQFAGGIMQHGYQCGLLWGATLAAGAQAYEQFGASNEAETRALMAARNITTSFQEKNKFIDCEDLTSLNEESSVKEMVTYFLLKGGSIKCFHMAGKYALIACQAIDTAFTEKNIDIPESKTTCTAELAKKLDASPEHVSMAAGLAGGIGLCGSGCGALGAAIWFSSMQDVKNGVKQTDFKAPNSLKMVETFLKASDYKFECKEIVGRKFDSITDHATHVCNGGCEQILDALVKELKEQSQLVETQEITK